MSVTVPGLFLADAGTFTFPTENLAAPPDDAAVIEHAVVVGERLGAQTLLVGGGAKAVQIGRAASAWQRAVSGTLLGVGRKPGPFIKCAVPTCPNRHAGRGLCATHYMRLWAARTRSYGSGCPAPAYGVPGCGHHHPLEPAPGDPPDPPLPDGLAEACDRRRDAAGRHGEHDAVASLWATIGGALGARTGRDAG